MTDKVKTNHMGEALMEAVVAGKKSFTTVDYGTDGSAIHREAAPGETVLVTARQLAAFPETLTSKAVYDATTAAEAAKRVHLESLAQAQKAAPPAPSSQVDNKVPAGEDNKVPTPTAQTTTPTK